MVANNPIYITGSQRSGSSWVAQMLATSPGLAWLDEPFSRKKHSQGICAADFPYWFTYISKHNEAFFRKPIQDTLSCRYNLTAELPSMWQWRHLRRVIREYRSFVTYQARCARPLIKEPTGLFMAEWLANTFGAQIVVLIRHPAAFVNSRLRLGWPHDFNDFLAQPRLMNDHLACFEEEIRDFAAHPHDLIDQLSLLWKLLYHTAAWYRRCYPDWLFIRHEDLARDPIGGFQALFQKLDLDFSAAVQQMIQEYSDPANPAEVPVSQWKSLKRHSQASVGIWKERLTATEIERVHACVNEVARVFYSDEEWLV
ncbi:MAG: sulfotransferase [Chloroflexi bacterium]|nr:sulfotransferase [Chloroflexota bacterium]MCI0645871.1 sulfotransferase [Chloroflexota bacterium]MCI0725726.1 sulfotransferase [Chloroflexota bacterium]